MIVSDEQKDYLPNEIYGNEGKLLKSLAIAA